MKYRTGDKLTHRWVNGREIEIIGVDENLGICQVYLTKSGHYIHTMIADLDKDYTLDNKLSRLFAGTE